MTEQEYIDRLQSYVREWHNACEDELWLVEQALRAFPKSARIRLLHGRVMMAAAEDDAQLDATALRSFEQAIALDPQLAEAHEQLGHYYDGVKDQPQKAEPFYRRAAELRGLASPSVLG